ncbi:L-lactate dehydrogenase [Ahniella affigens]|nr:L-lactate dehydrogenase [Ahniella affigens]
MGQFPATVADYRERAKRRLPGFLFDYIDGGAGEEQTLRANTSAWQQVLLRQRVLVNVDQIETDARVAGQTLAMPLVLAPIGLGGMSARRGEVQAVRAANARGVPFTLSTVGICGIEEVAAAGAMLNWFQLYMLRDRSVVDAILRRVAASGVQTLVFTVDLPLAGSRHRDVRNGVATPGLGPKLLRVSQVLRRPRWIVDVALRGKPLSFANLAGHGPAAGDFEAFRSWIDAQFDPTVTWDDIARLRERWPGKLILKGILDVEDAEQAAKLGADGLIVSNHGGRQLDGVRATALALPDIARTCGSKLDVLVDGGVRSGIDVFRALALGAKAVMIGRPWVFALAAGGESALHTLLGRWQKELQVAMALTGVRRLADIGPACLDTSVQAQIGQPKEPLNKFRGDAGHGWPAQDQARK